MTYEALEPTVLTLRDYAIAWASANGWELPFAIKRRDPKEPGRRIKEKSEDRLYAIMRRHWAYQKRVIRERMEFKYPDRKALDVIPLTEFGLAFEDELFRAQVYKWLLDAINNGLLIFEASSLLQIDTSIINIPAAKWARKYSGELIGMIDDTTRKAIGETIATFVETPGFTVGDMVKQLQPMFGEERAMKIAVTETTRAYGQATELAGIETQKEYPDLNFYKVWWTNNDDRVCPICAPLHGKSILIGQGWSGDRNPKTGEYTNIRGSDTGLMREPAHIRCRCWTTNHSEIAEQVMREAE